MKEEDLPELGEHEVYVCSPRGESYYERDWLLRDGRVVRGIGTYGKALTCVRAKGGAYLGIGRAHK
jgi:hypothetical protein